MLGSNSLFDHNKTSRNFTRDALMTEFATH